MNRRNIVLAGAAAPVLLALSTRLALAQQAAAGSDSVPMSAVRHKQATLQLGTFSKETSTLALQKAANAKLREFAGFEAAEQTTIAQVLSDSANPPPAPLDQMHEEMLKRLQAASGSAFDQQYLQGQIQTHEDLLKVQQAFLSGQTTMTGDAVHVAMLARTVIQMHIAMLNDLANAHA